MKYKALQEKAKELGMANVIGVKKDDLIKYLNDNNVQVEGDKFGYINDTEDKDTDMVFKSISAHIRYLFDNGMKQSAIAKQLQVRDQFVSNVVRKYKNEKMIKTEE